MSGLAGAVRRPNENALRPYFSFPNISLSILDCESPFCSTFKCNTQYFKPMEVLKSD